MKKLTMSLMTALVLSFIIPMQLNAATDSNKVSLVATKPAESADPAVLLARLDEINSMDKSKLNAPERKALRKELRLIKKDIRQQGGGVYISVGSLLIVIILLILLL